MKLARKLNLALIVSIVAVMAIYAYAQIRQEVVLDEADRLRVRHVALAWLGTLEAAWEKEGPERVAELVERANERSQGVMIQLVSLDPQNARLPLADLTVEEIDKLRKGEVVRHIREDEGHGWRHFYATLKVQPEPLVAVEFIEPISGEQKFVQMTHTAMMFATLAVILVSGVAVSLVGFWFVARPLDRLRDKARRVASGDFSQPLLLNQKDEIGDLACELNAMCGRLAEAGARVAAETEARLSTLQQLRHTDRLATVGQLAAGVAHELGTPLNVISARAQLIAAHEMARPEVVKNAGIINEQSDRMTAIIQQLLDFSRRRGVQTGLNDVGQIVCRTVDLLSSMATKARVDIDAAIDPTPVFANVDPNQLQQAVANIIINAIQAMPDGGRLHVSLEQRTTKPPSSGGTGAARDYVRIALQDNGAGIAEDHLAHLFEPFFTTKEVGKGTGLGLAVAHGIIAEHGGWIDVESTLGKGSCFSIWLPVAEAAAQVAI